jgi:hypothetical protein
MLLYAVSSGVTLFIQIGKSTRFLCGNVNTDYTAFTKLNNRIRQVRILNLSRT